MNAAAPEFILSNQEWQAVSLSIQVAFLCVAVSIVPGVGVAWLLARKHFVGKSLLSAIVHAPLVLPPVAVGYLLLLVLGRNGFLGQYLTDYFGVQVSFTWWALVIASGVMGFPLLVRSVRLSMEQVDRRLEEAAQTLGCSPRRCFLSVTLPLIAPGIIAGTTLAFARSLGEFGASIVFAGNIAGQTRTLPLAMYTYSQLPDGDAQALRLLLVSVFLSLGAMLVSEVATHRAKRKVEHT